jgi:hypothetical protein
MSTASMARCAPPGCRFIKSGSTPIDMLRAALPAKRHAQSMHVSPAGPDGGSDLLLPDGMLRTARYGLLRYVERLALRAQTPRVREKRNIAARCLLLRVSTSCCFLLHASCCCLLLSAACCSLLHRAASRAHSRAPHAATGEHERLKPRTAFLHRLDRPACMATHVTRGLSL